MKNNDMQRQEQRTIKSVYKWFVLGSMCCNSQIYSIFSITNIMLSTIISPIWYQVAIYYDTNDFDLNWITGWYYFGPILFAFPFNFLISYNYGISQVFSCILSALGLWILVIVKQDFQLGMLGFALLGCGEALYCQTPLQLSKLWFEPDERIVSTFISQYANNVGCLIGYAASSFYFYEIYDEVEFNIRYEHILNLNAIFASISIPLSFVTLKSPFNKADKIQIRDSLFQSLKKICTEKETFYDFISIASFIGLSWCYTLLFGTQQYYIGQTTEQVEITSVIFSLGQILAAIFCTYKLNVQSQKGLQQNYDQYIKFTISLGFWFLVGENLFFDLLPFQLLIVFNVFIGAGLGGIYSLLLESLMEKHYPVQELIVSTILVVIACALSFAIGILSAIPSILDYGFQISCFFMIPSYCYIVVFYETKFKRFEQES